MDITIRRLDQHDLVDSYKDLSPRGGVAYDLFGSGRTAVKVNFGKYLEPTSNNNYILANPITRIATTASRGWADSNNNFVPDCDLMNPLAQNHTATGGDICGQMNALTFGTATQTTANIDPKILDGWSARSNDWQIGASIQQQVLPRVAVPAAVAAAIGRVYYGASTLVCVPVSLARQGPALGAQAGERQLREILVDTGGFTRLRRATETPFNIVLPTRSEGSKPPGACASRRTPGPDGGRRARPRVRHERRNVRRGRPACRGRLEEGRPMQTKELSNTIATLYSELVHGVPGSNGYILNPGDLKLLASLDRLSAAAASATTSTGSSIAAHVDHLRYGLSLMNRRRAGENPFNHADWSASWKRTRLGEDEWRTLRDQLRSEASRWLEALRVPREVNEMEFNGMVGSIAHLAYHLGAIRQIDQTARGPAQGE